MGKSAEAEVRTLNEVESLAGSGEMESPDEAVLASMEVELQVAEKTPHRSDKASGDAMLSMYFRDMATHRVLSPEEEVAIAKEVEDLERKYWVALLAYPPAFETIHTVLEGFITENPPAEMAELRRLAQEALSGRFSKKRQEHWDTLAYALACKLRELDRDRLFVEGVFASTQRLSGRQSLERDLIGEGVHLTPAFKRYLAHIESARRAQKQAKNRFVAANLRLVVSIARRYKRGHMPLIDLIQEGNIGLMKAVERFEHSRGFRFSTYASWWIRHAIGRALADKGRAIRIPVHLLDTFSRVQRATQAIGLRTNEEPSSEELAQQARISVDKLVKVRGYSIDPPLSLDRPVNDDDGRKFVDLLQDENMASPHEKLVQQAWSDELHRLLPTLLPIEARILRFRFGLDDEEELTLKEIGDRYNLSRERIRQLQEQALKKIRDRLRD